MLWSIEKIRLELKYTWKISRNASEYKENFIVSCQLHGALGQGEVAPNIRYGETPENIAAAFDLIKGRLEEAPENPMSFESWLQGLNIPNALKFGIESALVHAWCKAHQLNLYQFLGVAKPKEVSSCYTLPIMDPALIPEFYAQHGLARFKQLKVKVSKADDIDMIKELHKLSMQPFMIDANEAWKDVEELIRFLPSLKPYPILFVEQPMPADFTEEYIYIKQQTQHLLMGDESVLNQPDFNLLSKQFGGINMKLMKAGGYINGIRILREAQQRNMVTMIGCMVETTLGIGSAWNLCSLAEYADLDGCLIVANEPFGYLQETNGSFERIKE